ncbi:MAG: amidohydrolase [Bacteroidetes bacterium]|nr:MAG: amidohydrolase [Bacteroidota bacterium]
MKALRFAALQLDLVWENPQANREMISRELAQLPPVDLVLLPEMFTTGFHMEPERLAEPPEGETIDWLTELAQRYRCVIGGSLITQEDSFFFNRFVLVGKEGLLLEYDKRHLFRMGDEHRYYRAGQELGWYPVHGWKLVPQICYDLRFPVWSRNTLRDDGEMTYDLLIYVANWPQARQAHWETLLRARAIENQAYVIGVNRVGTDGRGIVYAGGSQCIDPKGEVVAHAGEAAGLLTGTLAPELLQAYRQQFPAWQDGDVFEIYP